MESRNTYVEFGHSCLSRFAGAGESCFKQRKWDFIDRNNWVFWIHEEASSISYLESRLAAFELFLYLCSPQFNTTFEDEVYTEP